MERKVPDVKRFRDQPFTVSKRKGGKKLQILITKECKNKYIYQQIYENVKQMIMSKKFIAHEQLPSKRALAEQLDVSVNSVTTAYEQLLAEGYIYTIERSGYFVENITELTSAKKASSLLPEDLREEEVTDNRDKLSFSHISVDATIFPFKNWSNCEQKALRNYREMLGKLTHFQGPLEVRKSIARLIEHTRGVVCEPEQIVIGAGTQNLIKRLITIFPKTTKLAIENPGYQRFYTLFTGLGYPVHPISLDRQGISVKELSSSEAEFVIVTPSHQFPTGTIMPISRRNELLNWAAKNEKRFIIEDDYDSEYKYETDHIPSLQSLDQNQQVIYTGTFSKTLLPSLRISYMVLPFNLLRKYRNKYGDRIQEVNTLNLYTLHYFIEDGLYQKHIRQMNNSYEQKRSRIIRLLKAKFKDQITIRDIPAGLHFLAYFKTDKTYSEIKILAKKVNLEIYLLDRFMLTPNVGESGMVGIIVGFANIKETNINEAIERLSYVVNSKI